MPLPTRSTQKLAVTARIICCSLVLLSLWTPAALTRNVVNEQVRVHDYARHYRLVVPDDIDSATPTPLVFAFHGLGDNPERMAAYSKLDQLADREQFILVYPKALSLFWPLTAEWARIDLEFFDALTARMQQRFAIDPKRVYLVGMSNGAYFSHLLARERPQVVAAIAAHSGGIGIVAGGPQPACAYSVLLVHGVRDRIIPVAESRYAREIYQGWRHPVTIKELPDLGHVWGTTANINEEIWQFFSDHPNNCPQLLTASAKAPL